MTIDQYLNGVRDRMGKAVMGPMDTVSLINSCTDIHKLLRIIEAYQMCKCHPYNEDMLKDKLSAILEDENG